MPRRELEETQGVRDSVTLSKGNKEEGRVSPLQNHVQKTLFLSQAMARGSWQQGVTEARAAASPGRGRGGGAVWEDKQHTPLLPGLWSLRCCPSTLETGQYIQRCSNPVPSRLIPPKPKSPQQPRGPKGLTQHPYLSDHSSLFLPPTQGNSSLPHLLAGCLEETTFQPKAQGCWTRRLVVATAHPDPPPQPKPVLTKAKITGRRNRVG